MGVLSGRAAQASGSGLQLDQVQVVKPKSNLVCPDMLVSCDSPGEEDSGVFTGD